MVDFSQLSRLSDHLDPNAPPPPNTTGNLVTSALASGGASALGGFASAVAAGARAVGLSTGADNAQAKAKALNDAAARYGRSDIENAGFFDNGVGGFLQKTAYEGIKSLPLLGGAIAAAPLAAELAPEAAAVRIGAALPSLLRGGATAAEAGQGILGGAAVMAPQAVGGLYNAADEAAKREGRGGASQVDAIKAIALGVPIGAAQSIIPAHGAGSIFGEKAAGTALSNVARSGMANAAAGAVGAGLQTAGELSFRDDMSAGDKAQQIVSSAVQGGAFGGLFGGAFGLLHTRDGLRANADPSTVANDDLAKTVDAAVQPSSGNPTAPIAAQTLPEAGPAAAAPAPQPVQGRAPTQDALVARFAGGEPQAPDQTAMLDRFVGGMPGEEPMPQPGPMLALPAPLLRLTDQRAPVEAAPELASEPIALPDRSETPDQLLARYDAIRLPDRSGTPYPDEPLPFDQNKLPVDTQGMAIQRWMAQRDAEVADLQGTGRALVPYGDPMQAELVRARHPSALRLDANGETYSASAPPEAVADPRPEPSLGPAEEPAEAPAAVPMDLSDDALKRLGFPDPDAPAGPDLGPMAALRDRLDQAVIARDRRRIQQMYAGVDRRAPTPAADAGPRSIADRVTDAAHDLTGGTGGTASIADLRKALPDIAPADFENALRQLHSDDSPTELAKAPPGKRAGVDGITVEGQGRFHSLTVEPRDAGVQERSAATQAATDEPGRSSEAPSGDTARGEAAGTGTGEAAPVRRQGEADQPAAGGGAGEAPAVTLTKAQAAAALRAEGKRVTQAAVEERQNAPAPEVKAAPADVPVPGGETTHPEVVKIAARVKSREAARSKTGDIDPVQPAVQNAVARRGGTISLPSKTGQGGLLTSKALRPREGQLARSRAAVDPAAAGMSDAEIAAAQAADDRRFAAEEANLAPDTTGPLKQYKLGDFPRTVGGKTGRTVLTSKAMASAARKTEMRQAEQLQTQEASGEIDFHSTPNDNLASPAAPAGDPRPPAVAPAAPERAARTNPFSGEYPGGSERDPTNPGHAEAAKALGIELPDHSRTGPNADNYRAVTDRLKLMWDKAAKGQFDDDYIRRYRDAQGTFAPGDANFPRDPSGRALAFSKPFEEMAMQSRRRVASDARAKAFEAELKDNTRAARAAADTAASSPDARIMPKMAWAGGEPTASFDRSAVERSFREATSSLRADVKDRVHLIDEVPQALRDQAAKQGLDLDKVPAMYFGGEVYLRADMMKSVADVQDAVAHEVFGHLGTAERVGNMLGPDRSRANFDASMSDAFDRAGGLAGFQRIAERLGVWDGTPGGGVGLKGYLPEGDLSKLTQHQKAVLTDELLAHAAAGTEAGPKQRALMEWVGMMKDAIAGMLRKAGLDSFADKFNRFDENDVMKWVADSRSILQGEPVRQPNALDLASLGDSRLRFIGMGAGSEPIMPKMIRSQNEETGAVTRLAASLQDAVDNGYRGARNTFDRNVASGYGLVRRFGERIPAMVDHYTLSHMRGIYESRVGENHNRVNRDFADLGTKNGKEGKEASKIVQQMMQRATAANIDPTRAWEDHTWIKPEEATKYKAEWDALRSDWNKLGQLAGGKGQDVYRRSAQLMRGDNYIKSASYMQALHDMLYEKSDPVKGFENNAMDDFSKRNELHADPAAYEAFWKAEAEKRVDGFKGAIQNMAVDRQGEVRDPDEPNAQPLPGTVMKGAQAAADMKALLDRIETAHAAMNEGPYFHLGRTGDFFASFHLARNADGEIEPGAIEHLQSELEKNGFGDVQLNTLTNNAHVFIRVRTPTELAGLRERVIDKIPEQYIDTTKEPRNGDIKNNAEFQSKDVPMLERMMAAAKQQFDETNDPENKDARDSFLDHMRSVALDALPDNSIRKVYTQRQNVQGYSKDQIANNVHRGQITARSAASMATRPGQLDAVAGMYRTVRDAQTGSAKDAIATNDNVRSYLTRTAAADVRVPQNLVDMARGFVHSFYLAGSPAYVAMQLSQLGTLTLPELGRRYGYGNSMKALAGAAPDAYRVLAAIAKSGHFDSGAVTPEVLARSGVSGATRELLQHLANTGGIELGSFARSMAGQSVERSAIQNAGARAMQLANGTAVMSEVAGRLIAGIAAARLHEAEPKRSGFDNGKDYANHVLSESMFNWGSYDTPRLFSAGGPLGQAGPLVFQFHQFATKLFEKVVHESYNGFVNPALAKVAGHELAGTPEGRAEARRFMLGHLAAVTMLAGTLGLPAAGWSAAAATRLSGLLNNGEGYDVQAHYRDFLTSLVGKQAGEVLAHGVPRYLAGVDVSDLGDNSMLPMQRLLEDHSSLKDAATSYLANSWGSTPSSVINMVAAMQLVSQGRIGEALAKGMPTSLRNVAKAYQLGTRGYVNNQGERMPISASATDVIKQALGFTPATLANEREREEVVTNAKEDRTQHAQVIKQQLAIAMERGDAAGQAKWMKAMQAFDADPAHMGMSLSASLPAYLAARQQAVAYSRATGAPLGTSPTDLMAPRLANF